MSDQDPPILPRMRPPSDGTPIQQTVIKAGFKLIPAFYRELYSRLETERKRMNEIYSLWTRPSRRGLVSGGLSSLAAGGGSRNSEWFPVTQIPSRSHIATLVEKAFWASLQKEEGRALRFTIVYDQCDPNLDTTLALESPVPYGVRSLVKLAPAAGASESAIGVGSTAAGELMVWGLVDTPGSRFRLRVLDPGQLILSFVSTNVAIITGDEAMFMRDNYFSHSSSIWSKLQWPDKTNDSTVAIDPRVDVILDIVRSMRALGHGGALLIVPDDERWLRSVDHSTYPFFPPHRNVSNILRDKAQELEKKPADWDMSVQAAMDSLLKRSAQRLAGLTAVDGAAVVTTNLDVLGFGVKIREGELAASFTVTEIDPLEHEDFVCIKPIEEIGGKRHQSAARFVYQQRDAIALVASQDGNVTAFVWEENQDKPELSALHAYRRLELTLF